MNNGTYNAIKGPYTTICAQYGGWKIRDGNGKCVAMNIPSAYFARIYVEALVSEERRLMQEVEKMEASK